MRVVVLLPLVAARFLGRGQQDLAALEVAAEARPRSLVERAEPEAELPAAAALGAPSGRRLVRTERPGRAGRPQPRPDADVATAPDAYAAEAVEAAGAASRAAAPGVPAAPSTVRRAKPPGADGAPGAAAAAAPASAAAPAVGSFAEMEARLQAGQQARGPFSCFGKLGKYLCLALAGCAALTYLKGKCCGEKSCWHTWPACKRFRLATGLDAAPGFQLGATVHRARDLSPGMALFVALFSRRTAQKKAPGLPKGKGLVAQTSAATDYKWEQELRLDVQQGAEEVCVGVFKAGAMGGGSLQGWASLPVEELLDPGGDALDKQWVPLCDPKGKPCGSVQLTVARPQLPTKGAKAGGKALAPGSALTRQATQRPEQVLKMYQEKLSGPLHLGFKTGEFTLYWFQLEHKKGVWIWSWYKGGQKPSPHAKAVGRMPLLAIASIYEIPESHSDFIVRYRDSKDERQDLVLQRHSKPREQWVASIHEMLALLRDLRKAGDDLTPKGKKEKKDKEGHEKHKKHKAKKEKEKEPRVEDSDSGSAARKEQAAGSASSVELSDSD